MTEPDYRSDRSETREGSGRARRAWEAYVNAIGPVVEPMTFAVARTMIADLVGFWALWHLRGGFEGLQRFGYSDATIYRKIKRFRRVFGEHPDVFDFPGITIDAEAYWADAERRRAEAEEAAEPDQG